MILYSKRDSSNIQEGDVKYNVYIYKYSSGVFLYSYNNDLTYIYDILVDSTRSEYFFMMYGGGI